MKNKDIVPSLEKVSEDIPDTEDHDFGITDLPGWEDVIAGYYIKKN